MNTDTSVLTTLSLTDTTLASTLASLERRGLVSRDVAGEYVVTEAGFTALALSDELAKERV